ncbi:hypothetical protein [uncultured Porphyromonas sp.]|uniref:hypothetical protein n=1 Tax=uncultured Porphyromonas sp. TaxID=159274 RepID=UPI002593C3BA|nr:hypothetical protein [uncultured Porphyromonas sp.]
MEKFRLTDDRNDLWEDRDRLTTCIDGVRYVGDVKEELSIIVTLSTTELAKVVYLRYKNSNLISREVETFTDTMELVKRVKKYVDNLEELKDMKTKWYNWWAQNGDVTAEYEVHSGWGDALPSFWVKFNLLIGLEVGDRFFATVTDWAGRDIVSPKRFESLEEAIAYLSDVDCERYVDEHLNEAQKKI